MLKALGVGKGDVVGIYMPMVPEAAAAMLACARIGAIHNVVFGGFSRRARSRADGGLRARRRWSPPTRRCAAASRRPMKEAVDEIARATSDSLEHVVVVDRGDTDPPMTEGRDVFWHEAVEEADAECEPEPMDAEDPLFILYTSGSTGEAEGDPAHDRRLPDRASAPPTSWSST